MGSLCPAVLVPGCPLCPQAHRCAHPPPLRATELHQTLGTPPVMGLGEKAAGRTRQEQEEDSEEGWELGMHPPAPQIQGRAELVLTEGWKS